MRVGLLDYFVVNRVIYIHAHTIVNHLSGHTLRKVLDISFILKENKKKVFGKKAFKWQPN